MDARLDRLLRDLDLADLFDAVVLPSTCGLAKPDARIFTYALERLGAQPDESVYIGDREPDCVAAARAAGLRGLRYDPAAPAHHTDVLRAWANLPTLLAGERTGR